MLHSGQVSIQGAYVTQWPGVCLSGTCYTVTRILFEWHMLHNRKEKDKMRKQTVANAMDGFYTIHGPRQIVS